MKKCFFILFRVKSSFLSWLFGYVEKRFGKKAKVNFNFYDVTDSAKIIKIHIFPNIARSNDNQTMRFGQLIECNMRIIFTEKAYPRKGGEAILMPFYKNTDWAYIWIKSLNCYTDYFYSIS